jgi:hypothetical protein
MDAAIVDGARAARVARRARRVGGVAAGSNRVTGVTGVTEPTEASAAGAASGAGDDALLRALARDSSTAFTVLYRRYVDVVYNGAFRRTASWSAA